MKRLRSRALAALVLSLSFIGLTAPPAKADYDSERSRPGTSTWAPPFDSTRVKIELMSQDTYPQGFRYYRVTWTITVLCPAAYYKTPGWGYMNLGNTPGDHRGLEWDAAFPSGTASDLTYYNNEHYEIISGLSGDEGFYMDTPFEDGSTKRFGWGLTNPGNIEQCRTGNLDNLIKVSIFVKGPLSPSSGKTIVWKINAMTEDQDVPCTPTMAWCMFGDFHHTIAKTHFLTFSSTPGYVVADLREYDNNIGMFSMDDIQFNWEYFIPGQPGYSDCQTNHQGDGIACYDSGWYSGGDVTTGDGPPGDRDNAALRFGDIEGDNLVAMSFDVEPPGARWTQSSTKKGYATAEVATKCVTPKSTRSSCLVTFGYEGVADFDPAETRYANLTIPNDGNWYLCRVDKNHTATTDFAEGHDWYRWKIMTDDRWLAIDMAYLGGKTEYASNGWPANDMFAVNQCTNIGA